MQFPWKVNQPALRFFAAMVLLAAVGTRLCGKETLPAQTRKAIDKAVAPVLKRSGAPSASIAVVKDGRIVFAQAYGLSRIDAGRASGLIKQVFAERSTSL
jgi:CubicO group peptidase (beta-lactamase class C family)